MKDEVRTQSESAPSPSPGTPGEGRGEGSFPNSDAPSISRQNPHPNPLPAYRERGKSWILLSLILLIGAGLRIARINYDGLIFDEQWHMELSIGRGSPHLSTPHDQYIPNAPAVTSLVGAPPWYSVWTHMDLVVHPPLYCTILRLWRDVFGEGRYGARALSILCSLLTIALMFLAAREAYGLTVAAWAAAIFAVMPVQVAFAQQVRGYDMLGVEAMAALWALIRLEKILRARQIARAGDFRFGHFSPGDAPDALLRYRCRGGDRSLCADLLRGKVRRDAVISLLASGIVFLITWGPFMWKQRMNVPQLADPWLMEHDPRHIAWTLMRLGSWPVRVMFDLDHVNLTALFSLPVMKEAFPPIWTILPAAAHRTALLPRRRSELVLWCVWIAGTLGFVALLDLARGTSHLRFIRYIWLATPAILLIGMLLLNGMPKWLKHGIPAVIVLLGLISRGMAFVSDEPDWRYLGRWIDENTKHDETLIFTPGLQPPDYADIFYLGVAHYSHDFPRGIVKLTGKASPALMQQIPGSTAWLISGPLRGHDPFVSAEDVATLLPGAAIIDQQVFYNLAICTHIRFDRPPATTR